jgi:threonine aldolase
VDRLHDPARHDFASDNYAGVHPEILAALAAANDGHVPGYGADPYTEHLQDVLRGHFGPDATAYPVFNGTGANVVALQTMLPRWGAVICAETAHINTDENAAPERVGGLKLLTVPTPDGKLTPELVDRHAHGFGDQHRAQPGVVSITQATELGTVYSSDEKKTSHPEKQEKTNPHKKIQEKINRQKRKKNTKENHKEKKNINKKKETQQENHQKEKKN